MTDFNLQLRWADLDTLNHVNNVRYVDFAFEAMGQFVADGALPDALTITRIDVDFLRPLVLGLLPVRISSAVGENRLVQEICSVEEGGCAVFARVSTDFGVPVAAFAGEHTGKIYASRVRRGDLDALGHVTPAKVFELFQESRLLHFSGLMRRNVAGRFVVAKVTVDFHRPIGWRAEPWHIASWISRVGNSSMAIGAQIVDGDQAYARADAVLVAFDGKTQKSRTFSAEERTHLQESLSSA